MNGDRNKLITFEINKHGWVLLFPKMRRKWLLRAEKMKMRGRIRDESDHRMQEVEVEGGTKVKPKLDWDISQFPDKN